MTTKEGKQQVAGCRCCTCIHHPHLFIFILCRSFMLVCLFIYFYSFFFSVPATHITLSWWPRTCRYTPSSTFSHTRYPRQTFELTYKCTCHIKIPSVTRLLLIICAKVGFRLNERIHLMPNASRASVKVLSLRMNQNPGAGRGFLYIYTMMWETESLKRKNKGKEINAVNRG